MRADRGHGRAARGTRHLPGAQRGNRQALEAFFREHLPGLRRWAGQQVPRWLHRRADPDDIVQLAMIRALRRLHHLDPRRLDGVQPYLRRIVVNLVRDEIRKAGREPLHADLDPDAVAGAINPLDRFYGRERWEAYQVALRRLTPSARACVVNRIHHGLEYDEIARRTGRPTAGAARVAVTRALECLTREMRQPAPRRRVSSPAARSSKSNRRKGG
jgi:RNA polymerase sigma-70 factor (ECF subfamily)